MNKKITRNCLFSILIQVVLLSACTNDEKLNLFIVSNDEGKYGYIDSTGRLVIDYIFDYAYDFSDNRALVFYNNKEYFINKKGDTLFRTTVVYKPWKLDSLSDYSNWLKASKLERFKHLSDEYFFSEGYAACLDTSKRAFTFIDVDGKTMKKNYFSIVSQFHEGLAAVVLYDSTSTGKLKYCFVNKKGDVVINPTFDKAGNFHKGKAYVQIEADDKQVTDSSYAIGFDGYIINKNGRTISPCLTNKIVWRFSDEGLALTYDFMHNMLFDRGYFFMDTLFKHFPVIDNDPIYFTDATHFRDGIAGVCVNNKWFLIDKKANVLNEKPYENIMTSSQGLIGVKEEGKWKYLKNDGTSAFEMTFDSCKRFSNGLAYVEIINNQSIVKGYINRKGQFIWQSIMSKKSLKNDL